MRALVPVSLAAAAAVLRFRWSDGLPLPAFRVPAFLIRNGTETTWVHGDESQPRCIQLDIGPQASPPHCTVNFVFLGGIGEGWDWIVTDDRLCQEYNRILVEDEHLYYDFLAKPMCRAVQLNTFEIQNVKELTPPPWEMDAPLPRNLMNRPLISYRSYTVFEEGASANPHYWLRPKEDSDSNCDPDDWVKEFQWLAQHGYLILCTDAQKCPDHDAPFRLIFYESLSQELVEVLEQGITPLMYNSAHIHNFFTRNVFFVPYRFSTPQEMTQLIIDIASAKGISSDGQNIDAFRAGNHIVGRIRWLMPAGSRLILQALGWSFVDQPVEGNAVKGELLICAFSAPKNTAQRALIRRTWGSESILGGVQLMVLFFVGESEEARAEREKYDDIVILPMEDKFETIWVKSAAVIQFAYNYFTKENDLNAGRKFLLKVDDDAFLYLDLIIEDLFTNERSPLGIYWGFKMAMVRPTRKPTDKYFVPHMAYARVFYPMYARGMAYALGEDLVYAIGKDLLNMKPFPYREDVSVGLYLQHLAEEKKVLVQSVTRMYLMPLNATEQCRKTEKPWFRGHHLPTSLAEVTEYMVIHRFPVDAGDCLWETIQRLRRGAKTTTNLPLLCGCL